MRGREVGRIAPRASLLLLLILAASLPWRIVSASGPDASQPDLGQGDRQMNWWLPADSSVFGIEDLYKLVHQAFLGPGHAIPSREAAESYLRSEWREMGEGPAGVPLIEALWKDAPFVRVHMRPYRDRGGSPDSLLEAFLRSGSIPIDSTGFRGAWGSARGLIARGKLPLSVAAYDTLDGELRAMGYPAIHHSGLYEEKARPAYRVVSKLEAERLRQGLAQQDRDR